MKIIDRKTKNNVVAQVQRILGFEAFNLYDYVSRWWINYGLIFLLDTAGAVNVLAQEKGNSVYSSLDRNTTSFFPLLVAIPSA